MEERYGYSGISSRRWDTENVNNHTALSAALDVTLDNFLVLITGTPDEITEFMNLLKSDYRGDCTIEKDVN